ncbi:MAG: tyrosine--tRNA ligase, partial [Muribaculaceae bacterium]|nr:tyrosine--tRNA ligase [Muribaculaceae bacterium]
LLQGFDFLHLFETKGCKLQLGGSDQWGNITTGGELIRRKVGGEVFALTCPLITKPDGGKFGKTESGNVWLDARYTSPYRFYQFWLNVGDAEAEKYLKIFTFLSKEEIEALAAEHAKDPGLRPLQKKLAEEVTVMVHGREAYDAAVSASKILFSNSAVDELHKLDEQTLLDIFEGVPMFEVERADIEAGIPALDFLAEKTKVFPSKGEARKMIQGNGVSINKEKLTDPAAVIGADRLLGGKYILAQKGKKNYFLIRVKD